MLKENDDSRYQAVFVLGFEACRSIQLSYGRLLESDHSNARDPAQRYGRIRFRLGVISLRVAAKQSPSGR
jgi:hypothetical protein